MRSGQDRCHRTPPVFEHMLAFILGTQAAIQAFINAARYTAAPPQKAMRDVAQLAAAQNIDLLSLSTIGFLLQGDCF